MITGKGVFQIQLLPSFSVQVQKKEFQNENLGLSVSGHFGLSVMCHPTDRW